CNGTQRHHEGSEPPEDLKVERVAGQVLWKKSNALFLYQIFSVSGIVAFLGVSSRKIIAFVVFDAFTELFITLAIVVNTVFTTIFGVECAAKLMAMSPKFYFQVGWNVFDFIIVVFSLIEVIFEDANLPGITPSFQTCKIMANPESSDKYHGVFAPQTVLFHVESTDKTHLFPGAEMPRWNFTDFGHSFMIIFRVLCGEWIESMWDCMLVTGGACVPFFLATVVIGNLVVLNLFLALLLSSFGASNLSSSPDAETNKIAEAFGRIGRFIRWVKAGVRAFFKAIGDFFVAARIK
ncbi:Sodium channel protein para, partial [Orchesella cincta]